MLAAVGQMDGRMGGWVWEDKCLQYLQLTTVPTTDCASWMGFGWCHGVPHHQ